jgi:hypothetical protein
MNVSKNTYMYIYSEGGSAPQEQVHLPNAVKDKICICVRKRPISAKEIKKNDYDSVTCIHPQGIEQFIYVYIYIYVLVHMYTSTDM